MVVPNQLLIICATTLTISTEVVSLRIEDSIRSYFNSETVNSMNSQWRKYEISLENAVTLSLRENYSQRSLNVFVKDEPFSKILSNGFFLTDNIVNLLLLNVTLREIPHIEMADVTMKLSDNVLTVDAGLGKIFVEADYLLLRNTSDVLYEGITHDPFEQSPFIFQQVKTHGELTIIAEDCQIVGYAITTFVGQSINLGFDSFNVSNCKFNIEIYTPGYGMPPVIAPYFSRHQRYQLEKLISKPIVSTLMTHLQGDMYSYINTSAIFGDELPKIRHNQLKIFKETSSYMRDLVSNMNKITIENNLGRLDLEDMALQWDDLVSLENSLIMRRKQISQTSLSLVNMTLNGLDTAYSAYRGGPCESFGIKVVEEIRFNMLQITGQLHFENETLSGSFDFGVELLDVGFNLELNIEQKVSIGQFSFINCRNMDFSITDLKLFVRERISSKSFITGHLINVLPNKIISHLSNILEEALRRTDVGKQDTKPSLANEVNSQSGKQNDNTNGGINIDENQEIVIENSIEAHINENGDDQENVKQDIVGEELPKEEEINGNNNGQQDEEIIAQRDSSQHDE